MFKRILIANRGEIALRVIRTCRELGIEVVAVFTPFDKDSLHVRAADFNHPIESTSGYLAMEELLDISRKTGAQAIHPGYGFLSESAAFAELCEENGLIFIGPSANTIRLAGDKAKARNAAVAAGVPIVPGSPGLVNSSNALEIAKGIGYPVLIKAAGGGGGRGMRLVNNPAELIPNLQSAAQESKAYFNNGDLYLEKYIANPRHIEIQILADHFGNVIHLGERECSIQRRHQKLIEESPSLALSPELRNEIGAAAVRLAKQVGFNGAGTVEFLFSENKYYFMEINARIQVEHPVTEMVTGLDIVRKQLRVAFGEPLKFNQEDIIQRVRGWSIECRLNAEDPHNNFLPSPGIISAYLPPGGYAVRIDSAAYTGYAVNPRYDSMFGKLIVWGNTRGEAIRRMERALNEFYIEGIRTTIPFHQWVMGHALFRRGELSTGFVQKHWIDRISNAKIV
ncbi:MAG: acetyl-CoA carboxylase biotin carboxylase subunit [Bacillota bacterium]